MFEDLLTELNPDTVHIWVLNFLLHMNRLTYKYWHYILSKLWFYLEKNFFFNTSHQEHAINIGPTVHPFIQRYGILRIYE